jgi:hypothetical protein
MLRVFLIIGLLGLGVLYYYFFGPGPTASELSHAIPWWRPKGWAMHWQRVAELWALGRAGWPANLVPITLFCVPPLALGAAGFALFRRAEMRALVMTLALTLCMSVCYGYIAGGDIWRFFSWRFFAAMLSFCAVVSVFALAPSLLARARALPRAWTAALLLGVFAGVFLLSTEITGTDQAAFANLSPWPLVTVFGLLLVGYVLAALHLAAGAAAWVSSRLPSQAGTLATLIVAAGLACALGFRIFEAPGPATVSCLGLGAAAYALAARTRPQQGPAVAAGTALNRVVAGVLIAAFIFVSNRAALSYQDTARNRSAATLIEALEEFKGEHQHYPDDLEELVPAFLPEIPRARMGLIRHHGEAFVYTNFGDSYALEFASVQWVQCAYSPPYVYDDEEAYDYHEGLPEVGADILNGDAELEESGLEGSWSCETIPPKLY